MTTINLDPGRERAVGLAIERGTPANHSHRTLLLAVAIKMQQTRGAVQIETDLPHTDTK